MRAGLLALLWAALAAGAGAAQAQTGWTETKCARYAESWSAALARFGRQGLGTDFLARHETFLASRCVTRPAVCPRSPEELALADAMTVAATNAGIAGSFVPFLCRD